MREINICPIVELNLLMTPNDIKFLNVIFFFSQIHLTSGLMIFFRYRASQLSTKIALGTFEYLKDELDYIPWVAAQRQLDYLDRMLSRTELYGLFAVSTTDVINNVLLRCVHIFPIYPVFITMYSTWLGRATLVQYLTTRSLRISVCNRK